MYIYALFFSFVSYFSVLKGEIRRHTAINHGFQVAMIIDAAGTWATKKAGTNSCRPSNHPVLFSPGGVVVLRLGAPGRCYCALYIPGAWFV